MSTDPKAPAVDTSAEAMAGASLIYADGVEAFADRTKTDDAGWMKGLALHLRETAQVLRSLASQPAEPEGTTAAYRSGRHKSLEERGYGKSDEARILRDLARVLRENAELRNMLDNASASGARWRSRAEKAEAELAALKQPVGDGEVEACARLNESDGKFATAAMLRRQARQIEDMRGALELIARHRPDTPGLHHGGDFKLLAESAADAARAALSADQAGASS
jgi:hypothetical protein